MIWNCGTNETSVVIQCCKGINGTMFNNGCDTDNYGNAFAACVSSETAAIGNRTTCYSVSSNAASKKSYRKFYIMLIMSLYAGLVNAKISFVDEMTASGGYITDTDIVGIERIPDGNMTMQKRQDNEEVYTVLPQRYFEETHKVNEMYTLRVENNDGSTGSYDFIENAASEGGYDKLEVLTEPPTGRIENNSHSLDRRGSYMVRANTWAEINQPHIETGGISPGDFIRSLCYDRCDKFGCDFSRELIWTTNYINGGIWNKNVKLSGRATGGIQFGWSDQIRWDTRNTMCEMLKSTIDNAQVLQVQNRYGCTSSCAGAQCSRFGCAATKLDMWSGPKNGKVELWTKWSDGGESLAMWFFWEINQVGSWKPNICNVIGILLGFLGFAPFGLGDYATVGGLATSANCGS